MRKFRYLNSPIQTVSGGHALHLQRFLSQKFILAIIFLLSAFFINGQNLQNAKWCFGNQGLLDFNSTPPVSTLSSINNPASLGGAGAASVSDNNGQLLFYTNGRNVWDKNHALMSNGQGLYGAWGGHPQTTLIVPKPGNPGMYYIFTGCGGDDSFPLNGIEGIYYSVVNICANNGLGEIVPGLKNVPLKNENGVPIVYNANTGIGLRAQYTKITSTLNNTQDGIWVVLFLRFDDPSGSRRVIYSYLVSNDGISHQNDGVSPLPGNYFDASNSNYPGTPADDWFGQIKISPNGGMLCDAAAVAVNLYNFNNQNGSASFNRNVYNWIPTVTNPGYGVEFSPNSQLLYFSTWDNNIIQEKTVGPDGPSGSSTLRIRQHDMISGKTTIIGEIPPPPSYDQVPLPANKPTSLQLAIDNRIYVCVLNYVGGTNWRWLGAIRSPNLAGLSCDFNQYEIQLSSPSEHYGRLPQWVHQVSGGPPTPCTPPPTGLWVWMHGDNTPLQDGIYGIKGIPSSTNKPGYRQAASTWTDAVGNLWLFGGWKQGPNASVLGHFNDLWKYDVSTNQWTWMSGDNTLDQSGVYGTQGFPSPGNKPGSRAFASSWLDQAGNLWLFGGQWNSSLPGSRLLFNDLWRYNISTNLWTWIKGDNIANQAGVYGSQTLSSPTNKPGGRYDMLSWTDLSGNLWLHGGLGYDNAGPPPPPLTTIKYLADLWKYNISSNEWTWMKGPDYYDVSLPPVGLNSFGTQGVEASGNLPTNQQGSVSWVSGNYLYFFGGIAPYNNNYNAASTDNIWRYNTNNNNWTWMKGNGAVPDPPGVYGIQGVPASSNTPGGRYQMCGWRDNAGYFWTYGHYGNDLWKFDQGSLMWTWIEGSGTPFNPAPVYGTQGIGSPTTNPGRRTGSAFWKGSNDNFWLFGGVGNISVNNDLWKYTGNCSGANCRSSQESVRILRTKSTIYESKSLDSKTVTKELKFHDIKSIEVFNMSGQLVKKTMLSFDHIEILKFNKLSGVSRGIYILKISGKDNFSYSVKKLLN